MGHLFGSQQCTLRDTLVFKPFSLLGLGCRAPTGEGALGMGVTNYYTHAPRDPSLRLCARKLPRVRTHLGGWVGRHQIAVHACLGMWLSIGSFRNDRHTFECRGAWGTRGVRLASNPATLLKAARAHRRARCFWHNHSPETLPPPGYTDGDERHWDGCSKARLLHVKARIRAYQAGLFLFDYV